MKKGWFVREPPFFAVFSRHLMVKVPFMYFHV